MNTRTILNRVSQVYTYTFTTEYMYNNNYYRKRCHKLVRTQAGKGESERGGDREERREGGKVGGKEW